MARECLRPALIAGDMVTSEPRWQKGNGGRGGRNKAVYDSWSSYQGIGSCRPSQRVKLMVSSSVVKICRMLNTKSHIFLIP